MAIKIEHRKGTLGEIVSMAYEELSNLADEAQEIVDNASEGLSQTQRVQTFEQTAQDLYDAQNEPDIPDGMGEHEVDYQVWSNKNKRRSLSRANRCAWACALLETAIDAIDSVISEGGFKGVSNDDAESYKDELDNMKSNAEGCEFPGMYG